LFLTQAANYLSTTGSELKDWLGFDATLLETAFLEPLLEAADPTTVELLAIKEQAELAQRSGHHVGYAGMR